ncbi:MAG: hypothetical protein RIQ41_338 [Candidatus Parcubacteria bacterium]
MTSESDTYTENTHYSHAKVSTPALILIGWLAVCAVVFAYIFTGEKGTGTMDTMTNTETSVSRGGSTLNLIDAAGMQCNVVGVSINGGMTTYLPYWWSQDQSLTAEEKMLISSDYVTHIIEEANKDTDVQAIILEVDSGGGSPVAGEEIANAVKASTKPVVGLIRSIGASAAYWAVSPAKPIFASKNSDVGGIGVTASYSQELDDKKKFIQLSVGKYKDSGNPEKALTEEEKMLIMRDVRIIHENFIKEIAANRNLSEEKVRDLADGSTILGEAAKNAGLIDEIGSLHTVEAYLKLQLGSEPVVCWF